MSNGTAIQVVVIVVGGLILAGIIAGLKYLWRSAPSRGILAVAGGVILVALIGGLEHFSRSPSSGTTSTNGPPTTTTTGVTTNPGGPSLSAAALDAVLVPASAYRRLVSGWYDYLSEDSNSYALQGGLPALAVCNGPLPTSGLGADASSAYDSVPLGVRPTIYFGSDAASFTTDGATQLLAAAAQEGPTCSWRLLSGPRLDSQTVRLTTDQQVPDEGTLHVDLILIRSRFAVGEIGTETVSGSHSADAENLAKGLAKRLALAVHSAARR